MASRRSPPPPCKASVEGTVIVTRVGPALDGSTPALSTRSRRSGRAQPWTMPDASIHRRGAGVTDVSASRAGDASASSISSRASAASASRRRRSFSRQRRSSRRIAAGVFGGSALQSGSRSDHARQRRRSPRRRRTRGGRSASRRARTRTPRCRRACRPAFPRACSGRHVRGGAEDHAHPGHQRRARDRRRVARAAARRRRSRRRLSALASPKSSTFTVPSGRSLMLAGFRSRWTMPCSCAASSASAICRAIASRFIERNRALGDPLGERRPFDQLEDERHCPVRLFEPVDAADVRMIQRGEHLRFALKSREAFGIGDERLGQDLDRDRAIELRIARAIHLAHPACPERCANLIRAEPCASGQRHWGAFYAIGSRVPPREAVGKRQHLCAGDGRRSAATGQSSAVSVVNTMNAVAPDSQGAGRDPSRSNFPVHAWCSRVGNGWGRGGPAAPRAGDAATAGRLPRAATAVFTSWGRRWI